MFKIISKISLILIFFISSFLLFFHLRELIPFIGDQGWFYLSARDMLLTGNIPLVGITSSHVWLHQGPYWTYLLAAALWIGHFNPFSGAYLIAAIALVTILLVYKFGTEIFSSRVGTIAALFYATSPLIVLSNRMPYHTSPIATLTLLLFYVLYKWINGFRYGLPLTILLLTILYNFETATFMLVPIFILILFYGFFKKTNWSKDILNPKLLILSLIGWIVVMIPMILYDIHHGYPQTLKFFLWLGYKIATVFGFPKLHPGPIGESFQTMTTFASVQIQQLFFLPNALIAWLIVFVCAIYLLYENKKLFFKKQYLQQYSLLALFFFIPVAGYIVERTNSSAYLILFFPNVLDRILIYLQLIHSYAA